MTTTIENPTTTAKLTFESDSCGKCGGTGHLQHYATYAGGVCFSCGGAGFRHTRRGKASRAKFDAWRKATLTKKPNDLKVGDVVRIPSQFVGVGGSVAFKRPCPVLAIEEPGSGSSDSMYRVTFRCKVKSNYGGWLIADLDAQTVTVWIRADELLYRSPTNDELRAVAPTLGKGVTLTEIPRNA